MVLKGIMTIELTDEATGDVETVTEENMITEAVNNILGLNPMGIFYAATGEYDAAVLWNGSLLPICPNMIGGILLGIIEIFAKAYISTQLSDAVVFAVLIVVLLVKPDGLLGKRVSEKV